MKNKGIYSKLNIIFGLFLLLVTSGFFYFSLHYGISEDKYLPVFFLSILVFLCLSFSTFKRVFDEIKYIHSSIDKKIINTSKKEELSITTEELQGIMRSIRTIEEQQNSAIQLLEKKVSQIATLKELAELSYVTSDPEEILYVTLERALLLTGSDIGSIMILEGAEREKFVVKASIGLGDRVKVGDRVDFETSVAKYAVINKSPLVVEDIEKDSRFGRKNRPQYGTKSFICMPIKTMRDIVGVLTISRKDNNTTFSHEQVEILTPLLSNGAFSYENILLLKQKERDARHLLMVDRIFKIMNSSFRDSELLETVLNEIRALVPYDLAMVLTTDDNRPDHVAVHYLQASEPTTILRGAHYRCKGSVIDRVLKQEGLLHIEDVGQLAGETDHALFASQGCKACVLAPLKTDGTVWGILALGTTQNDRLPRVQELLEWVSKGVSLSIERSRLSAAVKKRNQELDTIKQIGSALASSTFDISQVLKYTMDMIRAIMNVEAGSLLLLGEEDLEFAVAFNLDLEALKRFRIKLGQGVAGHVAARGEPVLVNDVEASPQFETEVDKITGFCTRSALCVPIISQGKVAGVIEVLNKMDGDFSTDDNHLLQSVASSVSIAIENARLYREKVSMAENERGIRRMFQKFVPKEVVDKIIHGLETGKTVLEEFKTLTLLNIDIRGFSGLAKRLGPQKTVFLLNSFFSVMGGIAIKHQGIVDKYLGDGFLAIFGAPISSSNDADNAVSAALEMKGSLGQVNEYFARELDTSVNIGISVHTGDVVVGNIGFERKMDYTVIGDSVNVVFRLQTLARSYPNGILVTENTCQAALSRLETREIPVTEDMESLGSLKIYELLGRRQP